MTAAARAPVLLFAYARPEHLRRALESLRANAEAADTALIVYCDGAKRPEHQQAVDQVRALVASVSGFASVTPVFRPHNLGLGASIIGGVTEQLACHGRVIVVEDDLVVSRHFLRYMNDALELYANVPRVGSIHAYCYPTGQALPETFFLRGGDCWGWATWSRAWVHFNPDGAFLRRALHKRALERQFDLDGAYPFTRMLDDQAAGRNDSWAVRWYASCFLDDLLTLYPGRSLVHNIGNDASGTHSGATDAFAQAVATTHVPVLEQPIEASAEARRAFSRYLSRQRSLWRRLRARWRCPSNVVA
jgi:hypothetical protein